MEIKELIGLAKKEDWEKIDLMLPEVSNSREFFDWASSEGILDKDGNVRDLAVSIIEKSKIDQGKFYEIENNLHHLMMFDNNPYVRYRSSFALASNDSLKYKNDVLDTLKMALKDEEVNLIAKDYLRRYK